MGPFDDDPFSPGNRRDEIPEPFKEMLREIDRKQGGMGNG